MRISDWSSDVCSSDLLSVRSSVLAAPIREKDGGDIVVEHDRGSIRVAAWQFGTSLMLVFGAFVIAATARGQTAAIGRTWAIAEPDALSERSEEHTSELQSLMRISYAVFCLKKQKIINQLQHN